MFMVNGTWATLSSLVTSTALLNIVLQKSGCFLAKQSYLHFYSICLQINILIKLISTSTTAYNNIQSKPNNQHTLKI